MFFEDLIKAWNWSVTSGAIPCIYKTCSYCGGKPEAFKVHDRPKRWFWAVVEDVVEKIQGVVIQWKCPLCLRTFRQIPQWAHPYKRYATGTMTHLARRYLEEDQSTYRGVAGLGHADLSGIEEGRELSHVTLWRWMETLGGKTELLLRARSLIRQKDPNCPIFRALVDLPKNKYRSQARREILLQAKQLLQTADVYLRVLGVPFFHELGTADP